MLGSFEVKGLTERIKAATEDYNRGAAFYTEGLLISSLLNSQDVESIKCIRAELGSVAGGKVPEGLIHEELLKGARALLEPKTVKK